MLPSLLFLTQESHQIPSHWGNLFWNGFLFMFAPDMCSFYFKREQGFVRLPGSGFTQTAITKVLRDLWHQMCAYTVTFVHLPAALPMLPFEGLGAHCPLVSSLSV